MWKRKSKEGLSLGLAERKREVWYRGEVVWSGDNTPPLLDLCKEYKAHLATSAISGRSIHYFLESDKDEATEN